MSSDTVLALKRQLDEYIGPIDGDDPRVLKRVGILDAATALFAAQGYRKTSMGEVAKAAGVAKGTVYLYFEKKIDLLVAACSREKLALWSDIEEVFDDSLPARERLRKLCLVSLLSANRMPMTTRVFRGEDIQAIFAELPPALISADAFHRETLMLPLLREVAVEHPWTESELKDRVNVIAGLGLFAEAIVNEEVLSGLSPQRYAEVLTDLLVDGLESKGKSR